MLTLKNKFNFSPDATCNHNRIVIKLTPCIVDITRHENNFQLYESLFLSKEIASAQIPKYNRDKFSILFNFNSVLYRPR